MNKKIDYFGEFIIKHFRDVALECVEGLCEEKFDSPGHRAYQKEIASLSDNEKRILKETLAYCIDGGLNDFLFHLDKEGRLKKRIRVIIDGLESTDLSEGLHKELHGKNGWKNRFSKFDAITAK